MTHSPDKWEQARKMRALGISYSKVEATTGIPKGTLAADEHHMKKKLGMLAIQKPNGKVSMRNRDDSKPTTNPDQYDPSYWVRKMIPHVASMFNEAEKAHDIPAALASFNSMLKAEMMKRGYEMQTGDMVSMKSVQRWLDVAVAVFLDLIRDTVHSPEEKIEILKERLGKVVIE